MTKVKIIDISLSNLGFVILLQSSKEEKTLPIFIGMPEAQAIAIQYNNIETQRPLTHDLLKNMMTLLKCKLDKVLIDDYKDNSYYAKIFLKTEDNKFQIDSRPSDAIALALKFEVPIYVMNEIMDNYSIELKDGTDDEIIQKGKEIAEELESNYSLSKESEIEILKDKLKKSIEEERYEDAAFIRDELKKYDESDEF